MIRLFRPNRPLIRPSLDHRPDCSALELPSRPCNFGLGTHGRALDWVLIINQFVSGPPPGLVQDPETHPPEFWKILYQASLAVCIMLTMIGGIDKCNSWKNLINIHYNAAVCGGKEGHQ